MKSYEIDQLDGCVYGCPSWPGVWSDWCEVDCKYFISRTDKEITCKVDE